jgi:hypothetical protein
MNATEQTNELKQVNECPICMDIIEGFNNKVTTECGHVFHCSCLMQNTAHNGFGCPYCRATMAEIPEDDDDDDDDYDYSISSTIFEDDILTSFRMFHQRINNEEVEEEEEEEENDEDDEDNEDDEDDEEAVEAPSSKYVTQKLLERGITFEDLVKKILFEEHRNYDDYERRSSEVYGQFMAVISQFKPEVVLPVPVPVSEQVGPLN